MVSYCIWLNIYLLESDSQYATARFFKISEFLLSFCYHSLPIPPNIKKKASRFLGKPHKIQLFTNYSIIVATRPEPTVLPPSRIRLGEPCVTNGAFSGFSTIIFSESIVFLCSFKIFVAKTETLYFLHKHSLLAQSAQYLIIIKLLPRMPIILYQFLLLLSPNIYSKTTHCLLQLDTLLLAMCLIG